MPFVLNLILENFHWFKDTTKFSISAGKVYLSSIVNCFDGIIPCWMIKITPVLTFVNHLLDQVVSQLSQIEHPIIHSDTGRDYR
ncbi:DDE-type integrase/transposase/recombinase [Lacrimispora sp.]|uniref:DDE-type integrase/transposase/recombinase n=1 Tax=Lacrimispora sp. TaxID=2719234 RepID=UPI003FA52A32